MGADMTVAVCRDIHYSKPAQRWLNERVPVRDELNLRARLDRLVIENRILALDPLPDNYEDLFYWHEIYYERIEETEEPAFTPDEVHTMIRDGVNRIFEYWRDTTTLYIENKHYLVTGGLSWGDPPTEAYDPIVMVDALGLLDKPVIVAELRRGWAQLQAELREPAS